MSSRRKSTKLEESIAEAVTDAVLRRLYQPPLLTEVAKERLKWVWIGSGPFRRKVPRNGGEDFFGAFDRLLLLPDGRWHGIQVTTPSGASERRGRLADRIIRPMLEARAARPHGPLHLSRPLDWPGMPLVDVWSVDPMTGALRAQRWLWPEGEWRDVQGALPRVALSTALVEREREIAEARSRPRPPRRSPSPVSSRSGAARRSASPD